MMKFDSRRNSSFFLGFKTQENIHPEVHHALLAGFEKTGWLCFLPEMDGQQIQVEDALSLPPLPTMKDGQEKSPSTRLRAVMFRYWELVLKKPNPANLKTEAATFDLWYSDQMERIILHFKNQLPI